MQITLNKFDEIKHLPLKVFNRVGFLNNLLQDVGKEAAETYVGMFSDEEKKQMYVMGSYIKKVGIDVVRKDVTKGLTLAGEEYVHVG